MSLPIASSFQSNRCFDVTVTIANGETVSQAVDISGTTLCGIIVPANLEGVSLTLQSSGSFAGTYVDVYDRAGNQISKVTVAGSGSARFISLDPNNFIGLQYIKLESASTQTGDAIFTLVTKPY